eukprot:Hpha_TRINITY_DN10282_c0_g2::TRINITY_DN10282_c0_g2_i1::g.35008::m.35008/K03349/APC2; anaphase-promoting complex subunit 2
MLASDIFSSTPRPGRRSPQFSSPLTAPRSTLGDAGQVRDIVQKWREGGASTEVTLSLLAQVVSRGDGASRTPLGMTTGLGVTGGAQGGHTWRYFGGGNYGSVLQEVLAQLLPLWDKEGVKRICEAVGRTFEPILQLTESASVDDDGSSLAFEDRSVLDRVQGLAPALHQLRLHEHPSIRRFVYVSAEKAIGKFLERARDVYSRPQLPLLYGWVDRLLTPWVSCLLEPKKRLKSSAFSDDGESDGEGEGFPGAVQLQLRIDYMCHSSFIRMRAEELFSIVQEWPEASPALVDLHALLFCPEARPRVVNAVGEQIRRRVLHVGANTEQIILIYVVTMHTLNALFPCEHRVINTVTRPIQVSLRKRKDGLSVFTRGLINSGSGALAEQLQPELQRPCRTAEGERAGEEGGVDDDDDDDADDASEDSSSSSSKGSLMESDHAPQTPERRSPPRETGGVMIMSPGLAPKEHRPIPHSVARQLPSTVPATPLRDTPLIREHLAEAQRSELTLPQGAVVDTSAAAMAQMAQRVERPFRWDLRRLDVLGVLVETFGGREALVSHYKALLAEKLVARAHFDCDEEVETLERLKHRFGDAAFQSCQVILKDVADSRRVGQRIRAAPAAQAPVGTRNVTVAQDAETTALIQSRLYWPSTSPQPPSGFKVHNVLQEMLKAFSQGYGHQKTPRTLQWFPGLGQVRLRVRLEEGPPEGEEIWCTLVQGTLLLHVCDAEAAGVTPAALATLTELQESDVVSEMQHWRKEGLVILGEDGAFRGAKRRERGDSDGQRDMA